MTILEEGVAGEDECLDGRVSYSVERAVPSPLPERTLTAEEVTAVTAAFSRVTVEKYPELRCGLWDAYDIRVFAWDGQTLADEPCDSPRLSWDQSRALVDLLESLRPRTPHSFTRGDGDGVVGGSPMDAIALLGFAFRDRREPPCLAACDAEANGSIGIADAVRILRFAFGGDTPPDAPFPECEASTKLTDLELGCGMPSGVCR